MVTTQLGNFRELQEKITYEVLPVTTLRGLTFWYAFEVRHDPVPSILTIGCGCEHQENAVEILKAFVED
jgi:hypothetical protein